MDLPRRPPGVPLEVSDVVLDVGVVCRSNPWKCSCQGRRGESKEVSRGGVSVDCSASARVVETVGRAIMRGCLACSLQSIGRAPQPPPEEGSRADVFYE